MKIKNLKIESSYQMQFDLEIYEEIVFYKCFMQQIIKNNRGADGDYEWEFGLHSTYTSLSKNLTDKIKSFVLEQTKELREKIESFK